MVPSSCLIKELEKENNPPLRILLPNFGWAKGGRQPGLHQMFINVSQNSSVQGKPDIPESQ